MKGFIKLVLTFFSCMLIIWAVAVPFGLFTGTVNEAVSVTKQEFGPQALLKKYEWFKDAAAVLDEKQASIQVYEVRLQDLTDMYAGKSRTEWVRDDVNQYNIWKSEHAGIVAMYNKVAADYNAQMSKFNWRFTNVGDLPQGATEPLPREFKTYKLR